MRKLIVYLFTIFIILFIQSVSAFEEGDILNQNQVNELNISQFNTQTLQCRYEGIEAGELYVSIEYSCLSLVKLFDNYFVVIRDSSPMTVSMMEIRRCLTFHNVSFCQEKAYERVNEGKERHVQASVNRVLFYQTTWTNLVLQWLEGLLP